MAIFDGLVNWWGWGDAAAALVDGGDFATSELQSFTFADNIAAYGLPAHDGEYGMGSITYAPDNTFNGQAEEALSAGWTCEADGSAIEQIIPSADYHHPVIDPQVGHFGNNLGLVPASDPWFDPRDGWTFAVWVSNYGGYYVKRASISSRQYLVGNHLISTGSSRGWYIVADLGTQPLAPPDVTSDGLSTLVDRIYDGTGEFKFVMNNEAAALSLSFGPTTTDYQLIVLTYDGSFLRTYNLAVNPDGPVESRGTTTGEITQGGVAYSFGARYNLGADDNAFTGPWNGAWDEMLQWSRALSLEEIKNLNHACDSNGKFHARFKAANADSHDRFARARTIRGATGQTVPFDPAGHDIETDEPMGANVQLLNQTAWYKWVAPSTRTVTFHTAEGHPADVWSAAPEELRS